MSEGASPKQNAVTTPPSLASKLEGLLKLGAASVGLAAAMGIPAVYLHLSDYNVPSHVIGFESTFRAGVLPGILLGLLVFYVNSGIAGLQAKSSPKSRFHSMNIGINAKKFELHFMLPIVALAPFIIAAYLILFVGTFSYCILGIWLVLSAFVWIIDLAVDINVSGRTLYLASIVILVLVGAVSLAVYYLGDRIPWLGRIRKVFGGSEVTFRSDDNGISTVGSPPGDDQIGDAADEEEKNLTIKKFIYAAVVLGAFMTFMLFCMRWSLQILELSWYQEFAIYRIALTVLIFEIVFGGLWLVVTAMEWNNSDERNMANWGTAAILLVGATIIFGSVSIYTTHLYPLIPPAFGGGKPEMVSLWVKGASAPANLQENLGCESKQNEESFVRCNDIFLLYNDSTSLVLSSHEAPSSTNHAVKGVILDRDTIAAISWP